jgi:hypothetical protein
MAKRGSGIAAHLTINHLHAMMKIDGTHVRREPEGKPQPRFT